MKLSLLRRIWQQIHSEQATAPRQRLTGFEPLEPRMVLSGFVAYYAPDYLSPPLGDFSHIDRSGAEIARPMAEFGSYSDYNAFSRGFGDAGPQFGPMPMQSVVSIFDHDSPGERILGGREYDTWQGGNLNLGSPTNTLTYTSPLSQTSLESDEEYGSGASATIGAITSATLVSTSNFASYSATSPLAVDRVFSELRAPLSNAAQLTIFIPLQIGSLPPTSIEIHEYAPFRGSANAESRGEVRESYTPRASQADASLALTARPASTSVERGENNSAAAAALAGQSASSGSVTAHADGSTVTGQVGTLANSSAVPEQTSLTELTEAERLRLKRKLGGGTAAVDEDGRSVSGRTDQYDADAQVGYDATRPFDVAGAPEGQLRQVAASMADDGLIEVLASDITAIVARGDVVDQVAANRQLVMEPTMATYQAFEIVVDGDSQAADGAADAARLAAAVAMNAQPVVQAE